MSSRAASARKRIQSSKGAEVFVVPAPLTASDLISPAHSVKRSAPSPQSRYPSPAATTPLTSVPINTPRSLSASQAHTTPQQQSATSHQLLSSRHPYPYNGHTRVESEEWFERSPHRIYLGSAYNSPLSTRNGSPAASVDLRQSYESDEPDTVEPIALSSYQPPPPTSRAEPVPPSTAALSQDTDSSNNSLRPSLSISSGSISPTPRSRKVSSNNRPVPIYDPSDDVSSTESSSFQELERDPPQINYEDSLLFEQSDPPTPLPDYPNSQNTTSPSLSHAVNSFIPLVPNRPPHPLSPVDYPSPVSSNSSLPSQSMGLGSAYSLPLENGQRRPRVYEQTPAYTAAPPQIPSSSYLRPQPAASIVSSSGSSSEVPSSPSSPAPQKPEAPKFVYPGGRSMAKPKTPTEGGPKLKFKKKSKNGKDKERVDPAPVPAPPTVIHPPPQPPAFATPPHSPHSPRTPDVPVWPAQMADPFSSNRSWYQEDFVGKGDKPRGPGSIASSDSGSQRPAVSILSGSGSGSGPASSSSNPNNFVFPGGRSRAHPKAAPKPNEPKVKTHIRKISDPSGNGTLNFVEYEEKSKFMGITVKKKKKLIAVAPSPAQPDNALLSTSNYHSDPRVQTPVWDKEPEPRIARSHNTHEAPGSPRANRTNAHHSQRSNVPKYLGVYPLSYDSVLLSQEELTTKLLRRINDTGSPTFHNYGNAPPARVLDLGCGRGYWMLDAATIWKGYGTQVVGFDIVDMTRGLAQRQGLDNIKFVKGNFLKERLPFENESFDLVRISDLTLSVPFTKWKDVLAEVSRVLTIGGRLELIDDQIFFPLAKDVTITSSTTSPLPSPRLEVSIPTPSFSPMTPTSPRSRRNSGDSVVELYGSRQTYVEDTFDTATLNGDRLTSPISPVTSITPTVVPIPPLDTLSHPWAEQALACRDLEDVFEQMMSSRFGLHLRPSEFILDMLKSKFKHARKVTTLHLTLPPADATPASPLSLSRKSGKVPGLVLWPSTFIHMSQNDVNLHTLRHPRLLLSCRSTLVEYARDEMSGQIDSDNMLEALWEYERFLQQRFDVPSDLLDAPESAPSGSSQLRVHASRSRQSILSMNSVSSDAWDAMNEYKSDISQHFSWAVNGAESPAPPESPSTPKASEFPLPSPGASNTQPAPPPHAGSSNIRASIATSAPPYSRTEPAHVRTFHIYEAIKLDGRMFGPAF
ncbi:hypothetical protein AX16_001082 [Volvariella volvacea WC 439]|nr:hypothetical protein AX16_001082 [Volvariella volvacea WC 439]